MVSLVNFKTVNEELQQQHQSHPVAVRPQLEDAEQREPSNQIFIKVMQNGDQSKQQVSQQPQRNRTNKPQDQETNNIVLPYVNDTAHLLDGAGFLHSKQPADHQQLATTNRPDFTVTWRNLSFSLEPKWHQKIASASPLAALTGSRASDTGGRLAGQSAAFQATSKIVLDKLDGSFRSGELTAILGPSGAGKTTLLDCLTGHRKHGLSGSIRISASNSGQPFRRPAPKANELHLSHFDAGNRHLSSFAQAQQQQQQQQQQHGGGDNLKVSIIPQNDHLMGHLTVYETLNYASKMKNCFERHFDHKPNIGRVAQQLGLMSCLSTRINKLSGGQYKRVSIAQELLSSPDILILDEPTSGLDAMTCYQTVQVLRKLTDERQTNGQNQIAVILTIHQPNSDVFQQFNHVYVVAQGGKCIYEGPPSSIESVINRVGLRLPSSYYNPATMIVEVAACKFGLDSIQKLNAIQRKQYDVGLASDELCNSTGDSAVDCPSSSFGSSFEDDDDDDDEYPPQDSNNNQGGLVNKGFVMDSADQVYTNDANNNKSSVVVVVQKAATGGGLEEADSLHKLKLSEQEQRRKKRRRPRSRRPNEQPAQADGSVSDASAVVGPAGGGAGAPGGGGSGSGSPPKAEKRLKLNSLKADQKFPFWRHTYLHFHRSWLSIVRDPMLCSMQLALHIIVPVMVSLVYGTNVGKPNACPRAGPMDIMAYALEPTDTALQLQEDLRTTLENIGYIFFKLYGVIFAAMTVTVLTFPLDMHVLVKEFRNGWYGLSSYFLGRTLADIPFQLTLPLLAMSLSYYATGQPYSYMQWRFLSITVILILSSLIAQSQGLLFGAILMDKMKAAVFVAPAATTPIILFAGFLVRTQSIPRYLRPLSNLSYLRYAIEACLISRYGFNQCECDPSLFNQTVPELPPIARSMLDYWLSSFRANNQPPDSGHLLEGPNGTSTLETTTPLADQAHPDLFTKLIDSLAKANSFGRNITSCEQVLPYPMIDYDLKDSQLFSCFAILLFMLVFTRFLTFFIVCFKVKRKVRPSGEPFSSSINGQSSWSGRK